tara:strand:- start:908 stop:2011 length:1104 start_codon:yes stop_codon:yes gene_type:complete
MLVIALVSMAMIIVLSAFNGLEQLVSELFGTLDSDLALVPKTGEVVPADFSKHLEEDHNIAHFSAVIESEAIISARGYSEICTVLGVDSNYTKVCPIENSIIEGRWSNSSCVLGYGIKSMLMLPFDSTMQEILVFGAPIRGKKISRHREAAFKKLPQSTSGTFSINADLDTRYVITPLDFASELFSQNETVSRFEIKLKNGATIDDLNPLKDKLGDGFYFRTQAEKHKFITQTNRAEKWATFVILSFILIVAAFNILASLTMLLIDKKEDLLIFNAMGLKNKDIELTFSLQGLLINIIGGVIGCLFGIILVFIQSKYGLITLEGSVVPSYPVLLKLSDIAGVLAVVIGIGGLGSFLMVRYLVRKIVV